MTFYISSSDLQQILDHATTAYPQECCGLLLGIVKENHHDCYKVWCHKVWPTVNGWTPEVAAEYGLNSSGESHSCRDRYWIDPREILEAQKWSRRAGYQIIGIYHSHPNHSAIPSETDRRWAWADYTYLIISVGNTLDNGQDNSVVNSLDHPVVNSLENSSPVLVNYRGWRLNDAHQFIEESVVVESTIAEFIGESIAESIGEEGELGQTFCTP